MSTDYKEPLIMSDNEYSEQHERAVTTITEFADACCAIAKQNNLSPNDIPTGVINYAFDRNDIDIVRKYCEGETINVPVPYRRSIFSALDGSTKRLANAGVKTSHSINK